MKQHIETIAPILASAGTGLPKAENFLLRYVVVPMLVAITPWNIALRAFQNEGRKVSALARDIAPDLLTQRILVPRLIAMEDSSRYWSVVMAMRHLIIVGEEIESIIIQLSQGQRCTSVLGIATSKPEADTQVAVLDDFCVFLKRFDQRMSTDVGDRRSAHTNKHPWLGPLTAHQWLCLAGVHQRLHRRQIKMIVKGLG